jgi:hypothetical protein
MAISMRKPMRFKDESSALPMLTMEDFEIEPIETNIRAVRDCVFFTSKRTRIALAEMCLSKIRILSTIGRIIRKLYVLQGFAGTTADSIMLYSPKKSNIEAKEVFELQDELDRWHRTLPISCQIRGYDLGDHPNESFLHLHRSVLSMMFWMALEALHRPTTLAKEPSTSLTTFLQQKSRPRVKEAAEGMSDLIQSLREQDLVRFLPPISVAFMLPAIASFLVEIKSTGKSLGDLPGHQFHQCVRALLSLRDIWPIADSACFLVGHMITNSQIGTARTLGMEAAPIAAANDSSESSRESSAPQQHLEETEENSREGSQPYPLRVLVDEGEEEDAVSPPEIPGVVMPVSADLGYSPGDMGNNPGEWGEQFQFPWTMAEFGFGDGGAFLLDENDMYNIDPSMGDYSVDTVFNHGLMDFNAAAMSSTCAAHDPSSTTYPAPTSVPCDWNVEASQEYPQRLRPGLPT